jgi:hypothetical protein
MTIRLPHPLLLAVLYAFPACAGTISVVFSPSLLAGSPGDTLTFRGSLGTTTSDLGYDAFLNSASITLAGPWDWSLDTTPFLINAPLQLANGAASEPFDFFSVTIPLGLAPGLYAGDLTVLGGATADSEVVLGNSSFQVQVAGQNTAVPELSSLLMTAAGLGSALLLRGVRRRRSAILRGD